MAESLPGKPRLCEFQNQCVLEATPCSVQIQYFDGVQKNPIDRPLLLMGMRVDLPVEPRGWLELVIVFTCQARQEGMIIAHAL